MRLRSRAAVVVDTAFGVAKSVRGLSFTGTREHATLRSTAAEFAMVAAGTKLMKVEPPNPVNGNVEPAIRYDKNGRG